MKLTITVLIFFFFLTLKSSFSQGRELSIIDSLELALSQEKEAEKKIKLLNNLFDKQYPTNYKKALNYAHQALSLSTNLNNDNKKVKGLISKSANNVGAGYLLLDQYEQSLKYLLMALKLAENINDTNKISTAMYNIGLLYDFKGETEKGLVYVKKAAELEELKGDLEAASASYSVIAADYFFRSDYENGMEYYEKSMKIAVALNDKVTIGTLYSNRAEALKNLKRYQEALELNQRSIQIDLELNNKTGMETSYLNIAALYLEMGESEKAIEFNQKSLEISKEMNSTVNVMLAYEGLAHSYQKRKDLNKALEYTQLCADWKDSLYNQQNAEAIAEMQTKYDTEKKEAENNLLKTEKKLTKAELDRKNIQQNMLLILLGGGLLGGVFITYSWAQKRKTNKLLTTQNTIIEEKNKDITDSINYAQRIQSAILPLASVLEKHFQSFVYYQPKDIVSGDFYWVKEVDDKIYFSVIDCSGHGVPGAFMSIIGYSALNKIVDDLEIESTGEILKELNKEVNQALDMEVDREQSLRDGMDISICCIHKRTKTLEYSGANNALYLLKDKQNRLEDLKVTLENDQTLFYEVKPDKSNVGGGKNKRSYKTHTLPLHQNDTIYLFSDGYPDQFGGDQGHKFMYGPFKELILSMHSKKMKDQLSILKDTMSDWKGDHDQLDDISVMGVRIA